MAPLGSCLPACASARVNYCVGLSLNCTWKEDNYKRVQEARSVVACAATHACTDTTRVWDAWLVQVRRATPRARPWHGLRLRSAACTGAAAPRTSQNPGGCPSPWWPSAEEAGGWGRNSQTSQVPLEDRHQERSSMEGRISHQAGPVLRTTGWQAGLTGLDPGRDSG